MTAEQNHPELIVGEDVAVGVTAAFAIGGGLQLPRDRALAFGKRAFAPHHVERFSPRDLQQPCRWIVGDSRPRPVVERGQERVLRYILGDVEVSGAEETGEQRYKTARFRAKDSVDSWLDGLGCGITFGVRCFRRCHSASRLHGPGPADAM